MQPPPLAHPVAPRSPARPRARVRAEDSGCWRSSARDSSSRCRDPGSSTTTASGGGSRAAAASHAGRAAATRSTAAASSPADSRSAAASAAPAASGCRWSAPCADRTPRWRATRARTARGARDRRWRQVVEKKAQGPWRTRRCACPLAEEGEWPASRAAPSPGDETRRENLP